MLANMSSKQYLNCRPDIDTDKAHLQKLHNIICSDECAPSPAMANSQVRVSLCPISAISRKAIEEGNSTTYLPRTKNPEESPWLKLS